MKNIISFMILATVLVSFSSCEKYLDKKDPNTNYLTEDDVFSDPVKIRQYADRLYDCMAWVFECRQRNRSAATDNGKNYGNINQASGEVISTRAVYVNQFIIPGDFKTAVGLAFANPDFYDSWGSSWEAIYVANFLLHKLPAVKAGVLSPDEMNQIKGEAYAFRAFAYGEIIKRWGGVPYIKDQVQPSQKQFDVPRPSFHECAMDIAADCDSAIALLPKVSYLNDPQNMGRIGKAAAMALKSRVLTLDASPLNNPADDKSRWKMAAKAAWDVIALSRQYPDKIGLYKGDYNHIFWGEPGTIEGLWPRYFPTTNYEPYYVLWLWKNDGGDNSAMGCSPTQELVDKFETADGWRITDPGSGYTDADPYSNRDPRFYKDILYQGCTWTKYSENETIDMRTSPVLGKDRSSPTGADYGNSKTGYLARKLLPENGWNPKFNNKTYINVPYIRMAEMYLNYSEAVNEAYQDPKAKLPGADLTAVDALNAIRERVGMADVRPEYSADYKTFQAEVRNEFAVELCFEYHYWFDLIRWHIADKVLNNHKFHGMLVIQDNSAPGGFRYQRFEVPFAYKRVFTERNYHYPFRTSDLQLFKNFKQNPGW